MLRERHLGVKSVSSLALGWADLIVTDRLPVQSPPQVASGPWKIGATEWSTPRKQPRPWSGQASPVGEEDMQKSGVQTPLVISAPNHTGKQSH